MLSNRSYHNQHQTIREEQAGWKGDVHSDNPLCKPSQLIPDPSHADSPRNIVEKVSLEIVCWFSTHRHGQSEIVVSKQFSAAI